MAGPARRSVLTISDQPIDFSGELDPLVETKDGLTLTPLVKGKVRLELFDDPALAALAARLLADETAEDWFVIELASYLNDVVYDRQLRYLDLTSEIFTEELVAEAVKRANERFAEFGVKVVELTEVVFRASAEDLARLRAALAAWVATQEPGKS